MYQDGLGTLQCGALTGRVDVAQPQLGLHAIRVGAAPHDGEIGRITSGEESEAESLEWPARLSDAYVRGDDLVASYHATDEWPFAPQIYWRGESSVSQADVLSALSILVSVSTHLLDTFPRINASTRLAAEEVLLVTSEGGSARKHSLSGRRELVPPPRSGAHCLVWRLRGGEISYVEFMPSSDYRRLQILHDHDGECESHWEVFSEFLEKGVIRRARLQSALVPRDGDVLLAAEYCRTACARPLPLTT
jgi:hypothetical protein